jgi:hypothetical protein
MYGKKDSLNTDGHREREREREREMSLIKTDDLSMLIPAFISVNPC